MLCEVLKTHNIYYYYCLKCGITTQEEPYGFPQPDCVDSEVSLREPPNRRMGRKNPDPESERSGSDSDDPYESDADYEWPHLVKTTDKKGDAIGQKARSYAEAVKFPSQDAVDKAKLATAI